MNEVLNFFFLKSLLQKGSFTLQIAFWCNSEQEEFLLEKKDKLRMNIALQNLIYWIFEPFSWKIFPGENW